MNQFSSSDVFSCIATKQRLKLLMVDSSLLEDDCTHANQAGREHAWQQLRSAHAILVPGGFGVRGIGKAEMIDLSAEVIWHINAYTKYLSVKREK